MLALPLATGSLRAQALPTATAPGAFITVGGTYSYFEIPFGQRAMGGAGVYADLNFRRQLGIEVEARWINQNEVFDIHQTTYLAGPRFQLTRKRFSPYVKVLAGEGQFTFFDDLNQGKYFVIAPGAGLDLNLTPRIKVRVIDFEYQSWPQFTAGSYNPYGISAGISFRVFSGVR
jgi:Outer membrane protein beta-barrel domain